MAIRYVSEGTYYFTVFVQFVRSFQDPLFSGTHDIASSSSILHWYLVNVTHVVTSLNASNASSVEYLCATAQFGQMFLKFKRLF